MKNLTGSEIRSMWLKFFESKGHEVIESASLIPHDDPTLLWINAGVAPLKKYFDGREVPNNPRMTNAQKSIRTNDIDNVGKTARHHTFFEMLGNFSIGDYFRNEVLTWAAELLFSKEWFDLDKNLIYITYYPSDMDTFNKWVEVGIDPSHLIPLEDNFWEIGEGPCGPDTEIFFDRGEKYDPNHLGIEMLKNDIENDRYIEIWNIVFSQFNSKPNLKRSEYPELPSKNIDTGCGLERMACIMQGAETNYDSDLFMPLIDFISDYTGLDYRTAVDKMPYRVIADHIRSVTFAIADGAVLSNEGRGYVLRRILRRAVRYGRKLNINGPFLYKMVDIVVDKYSDFYPYLINKAPLIKKIVKLEEDNFLKTLENGEKKLLSIIKDSKNKVISGSDAFLLYDTFGFPIELTMEVCEEKGVKVDVEDFYKELQLQKERARNARSNAQSMNSQNEYYMEFKDSVNFVGYDKLSTTAKVIALFKDGVRVDKACGLVEAVTDETPFYAEMGGQIGDNGLIITDGESFEVVNCFKLPNGQNCHSIDMKEQEIKIGDVVELEVDEKMRHNICCNHSATHLLNEALRKVLGDHVIQHGSLVTDERLRFDFNHYQNLTLEEILEVEKLVNEQIKAAYPVVTIETDINTAKKMGAQAVFGEKYGDVVRLVDMTFSKELCGGTHVKNTSEINHFAILSIESKGSGIFRIEAATNNAINTCIESTISNLKDEILVANKKIDNLENEAKRLNLKIDINLIQLPQLTYSYQDVINYRNVYSDTKEYLKKIEKLIENTKRNNSSNDLTVLTNNIELKDGINYIICKTVDLDVNALKDMIDKTSEKFDKCLIFVGNVIANQKIIFIAKAKNVNYSCGNLVKEAAILTGGNGGGRADFAQAGGKDVSKIDSAIELIKGMVK